MLGDEIPTFLGSTSPSLSLKSPNFIPRGSSKTKDPEAIADEVCLYHLGQQNLDVWTYRTNVFHRQKIEIYGGWQPAEMRM